MKINREDFLEQVHLWVDYWWPKRDSKGLLLTESRSPKDDKNFYNVNGPGQTISLAASLYESASILESKHPELADTMRHRAEIYTEGFLSAPHDPESGTFVLSCDRDTNEVLRLAPVWGSIYGVWPSSYVALMALCIHRITGNQALLEMVKSTGKIIMESPFPDDIAVQAMDAGLTLGLLADLYDITEDKVWLEGGLSLADRLISIYMDKEIPRGAAGINWYESQMGPSFLLHGLARIALLSIDKDGCPLMADYTAR